MSQRPAKPRHYNTLLPEHEEILRTMPIEAGQARPLPGAILEDFQLLLDLVAEQSITLTDSQLLPAKLLRSLNEQLHRRIEHGLSRPQQKSFPHISGLFLLLRASGLTLVDLSGRKPVLLIDPVAKASWDRLTPEERYFSLLESWIVRGDSSIINEGHARFDMMSTLYLWHSLFEFLRDDQLKPDDWVDHIRYRPGPHNFALMELFGLVAVEDGPAVAQKGWQIADAGATPWGDALLALLWSTLVDDREFWDKLAAPQDIAPGELQPLIQLVRPNWQGNIELPPLQFQPGLFVFRVSLLGDVWREILIPAESTLDMLSDAILKAFKFDHDHLYRFFYATRFGLVTNVYHPFMDEEISTDEVRVGDLPAQPGFVLTYNYDFGDNWYFKVQLDRIDPPNPRVKRFRLGESEGEAPEQYWFGDEEEESDWEG